VLVKACGRYLSADHAPSYKVANATLRWHLLICQLEHEIGREPFEVPLTCSLSA